MKYFILHSALFFIPCSLGYLMVQWSYRPIFATMDYKAINRKLWNERTKVHVDSDFYSNNDFLNGKSSLNQIELDLLGDIRGKKILHLQCHFGQDSISLARMGAEVVGVDLSDVSIVTARELNEKCGTNVRFIRSDVYDLIDGLDEEFDMVFTTYGTIGWLPDLDKWADVVSNFLRPEGQLLLAEFHPYIWMYDDQFNEIIYSYFNREAILEQEESTYADGASNINLKSVGWNHHLGEVISALLKKAMKIEHFSEYDYSPYNIFSDSVEEKGKFRVRGLGDRIPYVYSVVASRQLTVDFK